MSPVSPDETVVVEIDRLGDIEIPEGMQAVWRAAFEQSPVPKWGDWSHHSRPLERKMEQDMWADTEWAGI